MKLAPVLILISLGIIGCGGSGGTEQSNPAFQKDMSLGGEKENPSSPVYYRKHRYFMLSAIKSDIKAAIASGSLDSLWVTGQDTLNYDELGRLESEQMVTYFGDINGVPALTIEHEYDQAIAWQLRQTNQKIWDAWSPTSTRKLVQHTTNEYAWGGGLVSHVYQTDRRLRGDQVQTSISTGTYQFDTFGMISQLDIEQSAPEQAQFEQRYFWNAGNIKTIYEPSPLNPEYAYTHEYFYDEYGRLNHYTREYQAIESLSEINLKYSEFYYYTLLNDAPAMLVEITRETPVVDGEGDVKIQRTTEYGVSVFEKTPCHRAQLNFGFHGFAQWSPCVLAKYWEADDTHLNTQVNQSMPRVQASLDHADVINVSDGFEPDYLVAEIELQYADDLTQQPYIQLSYDTPALTHYALKDNDTITVHSASMAETIRGQQSFGVEVSVCTSPRCDEHYPGSPIALDIVVDVDSDEGGAPQPSPTPSPTPVPVPTPTPEEVNVFGCHKAKSEVFSDTVSDDWAVVIWNDLEQANYVGKDYPADNLTWQLLNSGASRGTVIDVAYHYTTGYSDFALRAINTPSDEAPSLDDLSCLDLTEFEESELVYDLRILDYGENTLGFFMNLQCGWPCRTQFFPVANRSGFNSLAKPGFPYAVNEPEWIEVRIPVSYLLEDNLSETDPNLDLRKVDVISFAPPYGGAHEHKGFRFQLDNIRFEAP